MRHQPRYHLFKNTTYAFAGLRDALKHETSFKLECYALVVVIPFLFWIDLELINKIVMLMSFALILIAEAINSAIERVVDLVTVEYHDMAKRAKDLGSTVVLLSIILCTVVWVTVLIDHWVL